MKNNSLKLGFGAWQIGGTNFVDEVNQGWSHVDRQEASLLVNAAYEKGFRFFDTADAYGKGRSETILGEALAQKKDVEFCTKFGNTDKNTQDFSPQYAEKALSLSLGRLQANHVDHYLLHNPKPSEISKELLVKLAEFKKEGKIKYSGISVPFVEPFLDFIPFFDTFELLYNPLTEQNLKFLPHLKGKNVFIRSVFASGLLLKESSFFRAEYSFDDYRRSFPKAFIENIEGFLSSGESKQERIRKILDHCLALEVDRVILGFKNISQLKEITAISNF